MPLKVTVSIKVEDDGYGGPRVEASSSRTVTVQEGGYKDPQPKGYAEAKDTVVKITSDVEAEALALLDRAHTFDLEKVMAERGEIEAAR